MAEVFVLLLYRILISGLDELSSTAALVKYKGACPRIQRFHVYSRCTSYHLVSAVGESIRMTQTSSVPSTSSKGQDAGRALVY